MTVKVALTHDDTPTDVFAAVDTSGEVVLSTTVPAAPSPRPRPTPGPDTRPAKAVIAGQVDEWRSQFTFSEEGRRRP
jgi:hypothetical protein